MIRVLVVDDQPVVADAHRTLVDRIPGFVTVGVVHSGEAALEHVAAGGVDLVLLDFAMPGLHGLEVCRRLQTLDAAVDVIAITADRSLETLRQSVRLGIVNYILKPFTFAALREKLDHYAAFRVATSGNGSITDQQEVDAALARLREKSAATTLPKGMAAETLDDIRATLLAAPEGLTAARAAAVTGVSRVTARRYLEYLTSVGGCLREPIRGHTGRPEIRYRLRPG